MYFEIVRQCIASLKRVEGWLDKAEQYAAAKRFDVNVLLTSRLAPDMHPLTYQVQTACYYVNAAAAWLSGQPVPANKDQETTLDELRALIRKTIVFAETAEESQFEGAGEREVTFSWAQGKRLSGKDYVLQMTIPNVYFHLSIIYALLRLNGIDVGKSDFVGTINLVAA